MTKAQQAWCYLTALFLVAAVVLFSLPTAADSAGVEWARWGCLATAFFGWVVLLGMILNDQNPGSP